MRRRDFLKAGTLTAAAAAAAVGQGNTVEAAQDETEIEVRETLRFPDLVKDGEVSIKKPWMPETVIQPLYMLDWRPMDEKVAQKRRDSKFYTLPEPWSGILHKARFAIADDYMPEILRNMDRTNKEWARRSRGGFDTCVREYCMRSAQTHADVAFYLIADSLWSEDRNWADCHWMHKAMIYRFWRHQTGRGLALQRAHFDKWRNEQVIVGNRKVESWQRKAWAGKDKGKIADFYRDLEAYQLGQERLHPRVEG